MIAPRVVDRVLHAVFQLFPESGKKGETSGPKTGDAAKIEKVFKVLTRRRSKRSQSDHQK